MAKGIWVLAEQWRGGTSKITYELLALGHDIADGLGASLEAVLLGANGQSVVGTLGLADNVLYIAHPALADPIPEIHAGVLAHLIQEQQPRLLLMPSTNVSMDVAGLLSAQLDVPLINFCKDVHVVDGVVQAQCLLYGGKMEATVVATGEPAILVVLPGARPGEKGYLERMPTITAVTVSPPASPKVILKRYIEPEVGDVDISRQDILVAVGRGIERRENLEVAEALAEALGGAVCGSRPVIDQGWLPLSRQVGKSGATVKPKLYLAAGISGAPEHIEGMRDSGLIIAINTDPQAPIFNVAHYGVAADLFDILPALTEKVRAMKGAN